MAYSASVADILALDNLLDKMGDLERASIERAIQHRIDEAKADEGTLEGARDEYRDVTRDHATIASKLEGLVPIVPTEIKGEVEEVLQIVRALPISLDALDFAA